VDDDDYPYDDEVERGALLGLLEQNLEPLVDLLSVLGVSSFVVDEFKKLVKGDPLETDYRLEFRRHPASRRRTHVRDREQRRTAEENRTAIIMYKNGAMDAGGFEAAVAATCAETQLSRATIVRRWSKRKMQVHYLAVHGLL
jgi:hypothetical protein